MKAFTKSNSGKTVADSFYRPGNSDLRRVFSQCVRKDSCRDQSKRQPDAEAFL